MNTRIAVSSRTAREGYAFVAPALLYLAFATLYPLVRTVQMGFGDFRAGTWTFVGVSHFIDLLTDPAFWNSMRASAVFTVASTVLHIVIGLALALLINGQWFSTRARNTVRGLFIVPWVCSTAASALMWALLMHPFGMLSFIARNWLGLESIEFFGNPDLAMPSIIAINTWQAYPFYMIAILGGLQAIPTELYEAARVDGANAWQRFTRITLPQLANILIIVSTVDVITTFSHIDYVRMITRGGPFHVTEVLSYLIYRTALMDGNIGRGAALGTIMLVVLMVFTVFYLKLVSRGDDDHA